MALVVFPLSFVAAIAVGWAAGWLEPSGLGAFAGVVVAAAVGTLGKNVFEEGAWRGYLAPALVGRGLPDLWVWVISGTVWAVWHCPRLVNRPGLRVVPRLVFRQGPPDFESGLAK